MFFFLNTVRGWGSLREVNVDRPILSATEKDSPRTVEFSDEQIVHKVAGRVTQGYDIL